MHITLQQITAAIDAKLSDRREPTLQDAVKTITALSEMDAKVRGIDPEPHEKKFMKKRDAATKPIDGYTLDKDGRLKPKKKRQSVSQRIRDRKKPRTRITRVIKGAQKP